MRLASTLRLLTLPAAVALATALAVACSNGAPTAPDELQQPSFKKKGKGSGNPHPKYDDSDGTCTPYLNYVLTQVHPGSGVDDDGDGLICVYNP